jgi:FkbM family methyltransferase
MEGNKTGASYLAARARVVTGALMWAARWTPYLEPEMLGLQDLVGEGSVCVDVGSAAGLYTLALSRLAGASGTVHSIEPLSFAHPACSRLLRARDAGNVRHHAVALGATKGQAVMKVPVRKGGLVTGRSFLAQRACEVGANDEFDDHLSVTVDVDTLDELCKKDDVGRVDFIKIDVEGAELQVLQGAEGVIEAWRPAVLVEIEERHTARYGHHADEVVKWLDKRGYAMYTWDGTWRGAGGVCPHARNYLFRPRLDARVAPVATTTPAKCPSAKASPAPAIMGGSRDRAA